MSNSAKPSVLFIAGTLGQGGAEKQLFLLARSLKENGHQVWVISLTKGEYWEKRLRDEGIEVFSNEHYRSRVAKLLWIIRLNRSCRPNIVYSFHFYTSIYTGLLRFVSRHKILCIGSIRSDGFSEIKANGRWSYWLMHLNHLIIANNAHGREAVLQALKMRAEKIKILNNVVELQEPRASWPQNLQCIKIVFVGRLVPAKNPLQFVQICQKLDENGQNFIADIIGEGELKNHLNNYIKERNLHNKVQLKGNIQEASRSFSQYDFLITTSLHEGTPNVVLEALAAGLPVLCSIHQGTVDLIHKAYAVSSDEFCFDSIENSVDLIKKHLADPNLLNEVRLRAQRYISMNHSVKYLNKKMFEITNNKYV